MGNKTAPMPVLRWFSLPLPGASKGVQPAPVADRAMVWTDRRSRRMDALRARVAQHGEYHISPNCARYVWPHFTLVATMGGLWIAQDDFPPPVGGVDPLPEEWREVLRFARDLGYGDPGEPMYDEATGVYLWVLSS